VWLAADRIDPGRRFQAYAVLGDDIVIAESRVASEYASVLADLGVTLSHQKCWISKKWSLSSLRDSLCDFFEWVLELYISSLSSSIENVQMDSGISSQKDLLN